MKAMTHGAFALVHPFIFISAALLAGCATTSQQTQQAHPPSAAIVQTPQSQAAITGAKALVMLKEGNRRVLEGRGLHRDLREQIKTTAKGQYPYAVILSCMDSRTSSELLFDLNTGDVFNIRMAGNVVDEDVLGSMEYGTRFAGAKLIAVIGHTDCGAIKGAVDNAQLGNITALLSKIKPAVETVSSTIQPRTSKNREFVDLVTKANVQLVMRQIRERSAVLKELIDAGQVSLVGGICDLSTGQVTFYP